MRGNPLRGYETRVLGRSIPAHAGKPHGDTPIQKLYGVYPRSCGETLSTPALDIFAEGLSPLMRGNPPGRPGQRPHTGSIPAHAGKPVS